MHSTNKTRPSLCRYQCGSVTGNIIVEFVLSLPSSSMHSTSQHYAHYNYSSKFLAFQTLRHHWSTGPCLQPRVGPSPALSSSVLLLELPAHHLRRRTPLASRAKTSPIPRHALDLTPASLEAPDEEEACLRTPLDALLLRAECYLCVASSDGFHPATASVVKNPFGCTPRCHSTPSLVVRKAPATSRR